MQRETLPTSFSCLFCNHEDAVKPKVDKKSGVGTLECKVCGQRFQCSINYLSAPVDVYSEWVDAAGKNTLFLFPPPLPPPAAERRVPINEL